KEFGLSTSRVRGHKEVAVPRGRKPDPNFNMSQFRKKVGGAKGGVSSGGGASNPGKGVYGTAGPKHEVGCRVMGLDDGRTDIAWLPTRLPQSGYGAGHGDGVFGPTCLTAGKAFQTTHGMTVDGMVGQKTLTALKAAKVVGKAPSKPKTPD